MLYGGLTAARVDYVMQSAIQKAGAEILRQRDIFTKKPKPPYPGKKGMDVVTSADIDAQKLFEEAFSELLPLFGIIGEENNLRKPCRLDGCEIYITVNPLDGSKSYERHEAFGVSSMVALVVNGRVMAAYIYDINIGDMYGLSLATSAVWRDRIAKDAYYRRYLKELKRDRPLHEGYVLLREEREEYHPLLAAVARSTTRGGVFKAYEGTSGSIGLSMARLWNDQVVAHCTTKGPSTPWDMAPVIGISQQLGMVWLRPNANGDGFEEYEPHIPAQIEVRTHDTIVIHRSRVPAFYEMARRVVGNGF